MTGTPLTNPADRAVNRATLARQHLLDRADTAALDEIAHLGGMQAQAPLAPYVGLWSRVRGFAHDELSELYRQRRVVRMALMRGTIHLASAADAVAWRPLVQPTIVRATNAAFGKHYDGLDRDALAAAARELAEQSPRTFAELGALLAERFAGRDGAALAQAARAHVPLVQIPPRGVWGATGRIAHTTAEAWLGHGYRDGINVIPGLSERPYVDDRPTHHSGTRAASATGADPATGTGTGTGTTDAAGSSHADALDAMVLRYLAAFGPATVMDAQTWSGLTRLREVFDRLRPALRVTRTGDGRAELFDLPDAPRPDPDTPAPARFLPEYDNLLFSHADRTRINPGNHVIPLFPGNGAALGYFLLDGVWSGLWRTDRDRRNPRSRPRPTNSADASSGARDGITGGTAATTTSGDAVHLTIQHFDPLTPAARDELASEGLRLLAFLAPDAASPDVRFTHVQD